MRFSYCEKRVRIGLTFQPELVISHSEVFLRYPDLGLRHPELVSGSVVHYLQTRGRLNSKIEALVHLALLYKRWYIFCFDDLILPCFRCWYFINRLSDAKSSFSGSFNPFQANPVSMDTFSMFLGMKWRKCWLFLMSANTSPTSHIAFFYTSSIVHLKAARWRVVLAAFRLPILTCQPINIDLINYLISNSHGMVRSSSLSSEGCSNIS